MKKTIVFITIFSSFLLTSCSNKDKAINTSENDTISKVEVFIVSKQTIPNTLVFLGKFIPFKEATLGTTIPGKIEKIFVDEGSAVRQGQTLVQMSSEMLLQSQAEYEALKKDYQRVKNLAEKQSVSQQDLDHITAQYEAAEARYNLLKSNTEIKAPFDGVVDKLLAHEGENYFFSASIDIGQTLSTGILHLVKINPLYFEFEVGEKDLPHIKNNSKIKLIANSYNTDTLTGVIDFISPTLNSTKATATIRAKINNTSMKYKPGMTGKVFIDIINNDVISIPLQAIIKEPESNLYFVYIVNNQNKIEKKEVYIIQYLGENVILEGGLNEGEKVIISSKKNLEVGTTVQVIQ
ncbi:MAG TPA: efflux RND transporter periplasmic adaptor subunit [Bacteroidales bacterium]|nr:efflux RND transporter periplasmic adaptor subunit [Bacteroidales bacterium]